MVLEEFTPDIGDGGCDADGSQPWGQELMKGCRVGGGGGLRAWWGAPAPPGGDAWKTEASRPGSCCVAHL